MNDAELLRWLVFAFNDAVLSTDSHLEELYEEKRQHESETSRIESEVRGYIKDILIERAKKWTRPSAPTPPEKKLLEQVVTTWREVGIPAAVEALRAVEPEAVRIRVQSLLSREHQELWKEVRPLISSRRSPEAKV
jgi:hypothetical protein